MNKKWGETNAMGDKEKAWLYAVVAADLDLVFGAESAIADFERVLVENGGGESAWQNLLGYVPEAVKQRVRNQVAPSPRLLATIRYNYLELRDHPQLMTQTHQAADERVQTTSATHKSYLGSKRGNYAQTRHSIEGAGAERGVAAAHAFHMHHGGGGGDGEEAAEAELTVLGDPTPGEVDHLDLPSGYACVDTRGRLLIIDVTKGVSLVPLPLKLPISWILRTSQDCNHFMVGDAHECMGLVLGTQLDSAVCVDIHLSHLPKQPRAVSNRGVIVWGGEGGPDPPRAITWTPDAGVSVCTEREAKLFSQQQVVSPKPHGNTVSIGSGVSVSFPSQTTVVTCVSGGCVGFDCTTNENDFCRVDVDKKEAWCVGMETEHAVVCMAPLVGWM